MTDRRYERRVPKIQTVDLRWQDPAGSSMQVPARLLEVSVSGAGLVADTPVKVASMVQFACNGRERTASVRYCKRAPDGFTIGVEFEDTLA
jgi:hypothetical protein